MCLASRLDNEIVLIEGVLTLSGIVVDRVALICECLDVGGALREG